MTPRDDERRKFEAWATRDTGTFGRWLLQDLSHYDHNGEYQSSFTAAAWHGWLARAEQAETPRAAALEEAAQTVEKFKHFMDGPETQIKNYIAASIRKLKTAAAPVEDRPAPTVCKCGHSPQAHAPTTNEASNTDRSCSMCRCEEFEVGVTEGKEKP